MIGKTIIDYTREIVICVCFTNHALDQFLEDLIDIGVNESLIVRLGNSPKISAKISPLQLQSIAATMPKSSAYGRQFKALRDVCNNTLQEIANVEQRIQSINTTALLSWSEVRQYFENWQPSFLDSFELLASNSGGMQIANRRGAALDASDLWKQWREGASLSAAVSKHIIDSKSLWKLSKAQRLELIQKWKLELLNPILNEVIIILF